MDRGVWPGRYVPELQIGGVYARVDAQLPVEVLDHLSRALVLELRGYIDPAGVVGHGLQGERELGAVGIEGLAVGEAAELSLPGVLDHVGLAGHQVVRVPGQLSGVVVHREGVVLAGPVQ